MTPDATPSAARAALEHLRNNLPNTRSGSDAIAVLRALVERVENGVPCWTWLREDGLRVFDRAEPGMMCHAQRTLLLLPEETP